VNVYRPVPYRLGPASAPQLRSCHLDAVQLRAGIDEQEYRCAAGLGDAVPEVLGLRIGMQVRSSR
jgi:hypothetical protein